MIFSTTFVSNISHSMKNLVRYDHKYVLVSMQITHYSCQILMKLEFCLQVYERYSNSNFMKIRLVGAELFHAEGRTDSHDKTNNNFSQFFESA